MNIQYNGPIRLQTKNYGEYTQQKSIESHIKSRKWNLIGHTLRKEGGTIEKTALDWNPQGYTRGIQKVKNVLPLKNIY